jgi:hypothetical protein
MLWDAQGREFTPGASAYVCDWALEDALCMPYLWKVAKLRDGALGLQSRPGGESQVLTPALALALCLFEEPSFAQPEANADLWQQFLQRGWVIKAEEVGNQADFLFRARRVQPIAGQRNMHHLVLTADTLRGAGVLDEQRARLIWKYLLKQTEPRHTR